jgi:hypothetical protein
MKKLIAVLSLAAALAEISVHAQPTPSWVFQTLPVPTTLAAGTTTNLVSPIFIDASAQRHVGLMGGSSWSTAGDSLGNTNIIYTLAPTVDKLHWDTNNTVFFTNKNFSAIGGTTYNVGDLDSFGYAGWYITKMQNTSVGGVSTNSLGYGLKVGAP